MSTMNYFLTSLVNIINTSITTGIVPINMKIARVTPVFKVDDRTKMSNYRPISLLPLISKILGKVMFEKIMHLLNKYHILFDNQYGFRQNHSTYMDLMDTIDRVSDALDKKEPPYAYSLISPRRSILLTIIYY